MDVLNFFEGLHGSSHALAPQPVGAGGNVPAGGSEVGGTPHGASSTEVGTMMGADLQNEELLPFLDGDLELGSMYLAPSESLAVPSAPIHVPTHVGAGSHPAHAGGPPAAGFDMASTASAHVTAPYRLGAPGMVSGGAPSHGGSENTDESGGKAVDALELLGSSPTTTYAGDEQRLQVPVPVLGGASEMRTLGTPAATPRSPASVRKPPLRSPTPPVAGTAAGGAKRTKLPPVRKSSSSNKLSGPTTAGSPGGIVKPKASTAPRGTTAAATKRSAAAAARVAASAAAAAAASAAARGGDEDGSTAGDDSDSMSVAPQSGTVGTTVTTSVVSAEAGVRGMRKDVHNSHTRKCRAKVNTKFDELLTLLPPTPTASRSSTRRRSSIIPSTCTSGSRPGRTS
eukprot:TRINITY_DN620_c0_g1_i1.p1 TRINITY_DN620_c0_g1~~TRINITY_DN620_c0_g1_i1.p1  ORF type:complete len:398 (-),score=76.04 TRINITY_DN620_c0_g1_i1:1551-2744(-)